MSDNRSQFQDRDDDGLSPAAAPDQAPYQEDAMALTKRTTSPAFQFYPSDFLKDENVLLMSYTEIGVYQVLLCHAWNNRGLPSNTSEIAAMLKLPHARFKRLWAGPIGKCFTERSGRFVNGRQERERQKQDEYRKRQSENGSRGGRHNKAVANPSLPSGEARALKTEDLNSTAFQKKEERHDLTFKAFWELYPSHRRKSGAFVEQLFLQQVAQAGGAEPLMDALRNHVASAQWRAGKVEKMDRWLTEQLWKNTLPAEDVKADSRLPEWAR